MKGPEGGPVNNKNVQELGNESPPTREFVVEALRRDPSERALFNSYVLRREQEVGAENTPRAGLLLTVEFAGICRDAGLLEEAEELFEIALQQAEQRREFADIANQCLKELEELLKS